MSKKLTPRQKKLIALMPKVEAGEMTQQDALRQAGYAESVAQQQSSALGSIRSNTKMQDALKKAGFTEEYLAEGVVEGTKATAGDEEKPDYRSRGIFYKLGAELLDAFPAQKSITADVGIETLLDEAEAKADPA